jgi:hypothetical protein
VDGRALRLQDGDRVRYSASALDSGERMIAFDSRAFTFHLQPDTRARIRDDGLHFYSRLVLPQGTHHVRVVVEQTGGAAGVGTTTVTVPDFTESTLFFSDLSVGLRGSAMVTPLTDRTLRRELPGGVTRARTFRPSDELEIFAEVYDVHWPLVPRLDVTWSIVPADGGRAIMSGRQSIDSVFGGHARFRGHVALKSIRPGRYVLNTEALSAIGPPAIAVAQMEFTVLPQGPR